MADQTDINIIQAEFLTLREGVKTVHIATRSAEGLPEVSYAPYIWFEQSCYLYLSELARHTINLTLNPNTSLLFIESEEKTRNQFARRRIILQARTHAVERQTPLFWTVMVLFRKRFGNIVDVIEPLQDFHLFQVDPVSGRFVRGFAQAFELMGEGMSEISHHVGPN